MLLTPIALATAEDDLSNSCRTDFETTRLWLLAADRVLKELWDNEEDAVYDNEEPIMELNLTIPREVELCHEGRWIAWDAEQRMVLADGDSMDEVLDATDAVREAGKLIWYHHILSRDELIVGGL